jgi:hypothetical protein
MVCQATVPVSQRAFKSILSSMRAAKMKMPSIA